MRCPHHASALLGRGVLEVGKYPHAAEQHRAFQCCRRERSKDEQQRRNAEQQLRGIDRAVEQSVGPVCAAVIRLCHLAGCMPRVLYRGCAADRIRHRDELLKGERVIVKPGRHIHGQPAHAVEICFTPRMSVRPRQRDRAALRRLHLCRSQQITLAVARRNTVRAQRHSGRGGILHRIALAVRNHASGSSLPGASDGVSV